MSFYEMQIERPLSCLVSITSYVPPYSLDDLLLMLRFLAYKLYLIKVVPESSAILGLSNELVLSLNAGHRSMCRYNSEENQNYILVESAIKELVSPKALSSHGTTSEYNIDDFISWLPLTEYLLIKPTVSNPPADGSIRWNEEPSICFRGNNIREQISTKLSAWEGNNCE